MEIAKAAQKTALSRGRPRMFKQTSKLETTSVAIPMTAAAAASQKGTLRARPQMLAAQTARQTMGAALHLRIRRRGTQQVPLCSCLCFQQHLLCRTYSESVYAAVCYLSYLSHPHVSVCCLKSEVCFVCMRWYKRIGIDCSGGVQSIA